jgi:hypothetical protein
MTRSHHYLGLALPCVVGKYNKMRQRLASSSNPPYAFVLAHAHTPIITGDKYLLRSSRLFAVNRSEKTNHRHTDPSISSSSSSSALLSPPPKKKNKYENFSKTDADVDPFWRRWCKSPTKVQQLDDEKQTEQRIQSQNRLFRYHPRLIILTQEYWSLRSGDVWTWRWVLLLVLTVQWMTAIDHGLPLELCKAGIRHLKPPMKTSATACRSLQGKHRSEDE